MKEFFLKLVFICLSFKHFQLIMMLKLISHPFEYRFKRQNVVQSKTVAIIYLCYCFVIWLLIIAWVLSHEGHVKKNTNAKSTNVFKILNMNSSFKTNFSMDKFKPYVQPEELVNYNRLWNVDDYTVIFPDEIQILTNFIITSNQTMSTCPEHPYFTYGKCHPQKYDCFNLKTLTLEHGIFTGRCIASDFHDTNQNRNSCELKGIYKNYFTKIIFQKLIFY